MRSRLFFLTGVLVLVLASSCGRETALRGDTISLRARFTLARIDGRPLPVAESVFSRRVVNGALELYRRDSLHIISGTVDFFLDRMPCEALRVMARMPGTGGLGAVSDTSTVGCDEFRIETDTETVGYVLRADSLTVLSTPLASGTVRGDTLALTVRHRIEPDEGPPREWSQLWLYVRR